MRNFVQEDSLMYLFNASKPYLGYGSVIWKGATNTYINKLKISLRNWLWPLKSHMSQLKVFINTKKF